MLVEYFASNKVATKGITVFLNLQTSFSKISPLLKWEKDIGRSFSESQWLLAFKASFRATRSSNLWELVHKISRRWYITRSLIHTFDPAMQPSCWRNCGEPGSLYHNLLQCNVVSTLWSEVFQLLSEVTGISIDLSPERALLSIGIESIPPGLQYITTHILLSTRLAIAHHWETPDPISTT